MYTIHITEPAEHDLWEAVRYISEKLRNRKAALRLLDDAEAAISTLSEMPYRCSLVIDELLAREGFRLLPVHNYLVLYIVREETASVTVERFLYNRRDWQNILTESVE